VCGADFDPAAGVPFPEVPFVLDDLFDVGGGVAGREGAGLVDEPCLGVAGDGGRSTWMVCPAVAVAPSLAVTLRVTL
jgi:hypothetical protein